MQVKWIGKQIWQFITFILQHAINVNFHTSNLSVNPQITPSFKKFQLLLSHYYYRGMNCASNLFKYRQLHGDHKKLCSPKLVWNSISIPMHCKTSDCEFSAILICDQKSVFAIFLTFHKNRMIFKKFLDSHLMSQENIQQGFHTLYYYYTNSEQPRKQKKIHNNENIHIIYFSGLA